MENAIHDSVLKLGSHLHLEREKAYAQVIQFCATNKDEIAKELQTQIPVLSESKVWEERFGGLLAMEIFIKHSDKLDDYINTKCSVLINDHEARVRSAVGKALKMLLISRGMQIYDKWKGVLYDNVHAFLKREADNAVFDLGQPKNVEVYYENPDLGKNAPIMHDTEGWKSLETTMKVLQELIDGAGDKIIPYCNKEMFDMFQVTSAHLNRFVREITFNVINSLFKATAHSGIKDVGKIFAPLVAKGLADNWSQVKYAASIANRQLFMSIPDQADRKTFFSVLLPGMCLNRYYLAEGVRLYSIDTWKQVMGTMGKEYVVEFIDQITQYYIAQSRADNHAVREASCHCIAELCKKVAVNHKELVDKYVTSLFQVLMECFKDMSWTVRDAACVACGEFLLVFPDTAKSQIDVIYKLMKTHISDNISSVRENTAIALGKMLKVYPHLKDEIVKMIEESLPAAKNQPPDSKTFTKLANVTKFGVAPDVMIDEKHIDKQMYSCGSLAPKLKKGGGDVDYGFEKGTELWEVSDGCVYLLREFTNIYPKEGVKYFKSLEDLLRLDGFKHSSNLKETILKCIPDIMKSVGKSLCKEYIEVFADHIFRCVRSDNRNLQIVAENCLVEWSKLIGKSIMAGRLEAINPQYKEAFALLK